VVLKTPVDKANKGKSALTSDDANGPGADRQKILALTLDKIEKDFGKGAIMKLGSQHVVSADAIPSGAMSLDMALGIGGVPRGRIVEIYGPESSGKTTLTLSIVAQAQRAGGIAAFIDAEHALDPEYAGKIGVNIDELLVSQPDTGEQALDIAEQLVRSGAVDVIVVDSVAALVPKAEIDGDMGDAHVGLQARLMSQALRKLTAVVGKTRCTVIFINQLRQKIGVMYGNPETTTGGNALKFYASVRMDIRKIETLKRDNEEYGNRVRVKVVKNKVAPPFRVAEFDILFGEGISSESCLLDVATELEIVKKAGTWFSYNGEKVGQGREKARDFLKETPAVRDEIEAAVRARLAELRANKAAATPAAAPLISAEMPTYTSALGTPIVLADEDALPGEDD
jgi:recombination protein RecA